MFIITFLISVFRAAFGEYGVALKKASSGALIMFLFGIAGAIGTAVLSLPVFHREWGMPYPMAALMSTSISVIMYFLLNYLSNPLVSLFHGNRVESHTRVFIFASVVIALIIGAFDINNNLKGADIIVEDKHSVMNFERWIDTENYLLDERKAIETDSSVLESMMVVDKKGRKVVQWENRKNGAHSKAVAALAASNKAYTDAKNDLRPEYEKYASKAGAKRKSKEMVYRGSSWLLYILIFLTAVGQEDFSNRCEDVENGLIQAGAQVGAFRRKQYQKRMQVAPKNVGSGMPFSINVNTGNSPAKSSIRGLGRTVGEKVVHAIETGKVDRSILQKTTKEQNRIALDLGLCRDGRTFQNHIEVLRMVNFDLDQYKKSFK